MGSPREAEPRAFKARALHGPASRSSETDVTRSNGGRARASPGSGSVGVRAQRRARARVRPRRQMALRCPLPAGGQLAKVPAAAAAALAGRRCSVVPGGSEAQSGTASGDIFSGRRGRLKGIGVGGCGSGELSSAPLRGLQPRSSARRRESSEEKGAAEPPRPESAARQRRPGWARAPTGRAGPARRRGRRGAGEARRGAWPRPWWRGEPRGRGCLPGRCW